MSNFEPINFKKVCEWISTAGDIMSPVNGAQTLCR